jgi:hypothetical protein
MRKHLVLPEEKYIRSNCRRYLAHGEANKAARPHHMNMRCLSCCAMAADSPHMRFSTLSEFARAYPRALNKKRETTQDQLRQTL